MKIKKKFHSANLLQKRRATLSLVSVYIPHYVSLNNMSGMRMPSYRGISLCDSMYLFKNYFTSPTSLLLFGKTYYFKQ